MFKKFLIVAILLIIIIGGIWYVVLNNQKYITYKDNSFKMKYPDWPKTDEKNILDPIGIKLALTNDNCGFVLKIVDTPVGENFKSYTEKRLSEQQLQSVYPFEIISMEILDETSHIESLFTINNVQIKSVSYGYFVNNNQSYVIAFIAPKDQFEKFCQPVINKTIKSVIVK
jgi:hypothetical protein